MNDIVTVIEPLGNGVHIELASGHRANIAYLLAAVGNVYYRDILIIDGTQQIPAAEFVASIYNGTTPIPELVLTSAQTPAAAPEIDYEHQLAAMC